MIYPLWGGGFWAQSWIQVEGVCFLFPIVCMHLLKRDQAGGGGAGWESTRPGGWSCSIPLSSQDFWTHTHMHLEKYAFWLRGQMRECTSKVKGAAVVKDPGLCHVLETRGQATGCSREGGWSRGAPRDHGLEGHGVSFWPVPRHLDFILGVMESYW